MSTACEVRINTTAGSDNNVNVGHFVDIDCKEGKFSVPDSSFPHEALLPSDTDVFVDEHSSIPEVLQAPTKQVSVLFQSTFFLANVAIWFAKFPFTQIVLPLQILAFDPANKINDLALVVGVGAFAGLVANPLAGALSDRTTSRLGRRRPWIIAGTIISVVVLLLLAYAPSISLLLLEWTLYQIAINAVLAALLALLPDQVPLQQRATVSSFTGLSIPLGLVLGSLFVTGVLKQAVQPSYYIIGAIFLVSMLLIVLVTPDKIMKKELLSAFNLKEFLTSFWISPRKHPDFAWAWITRFLIILSSTVVTDYLLYYLQDTQHYTAKAAASGVTTFNSIYGIVLILAAFLSGVLSDKFQRRKVFVIIAGLIVAASMLLLAFVQTRTGLLISAALFGLGFGIYLAVDVALVTQVLPKASDRAKDLGVFTAASSLPQVLVPIIASPLINVFHSYALIFVIVAIAAVLSGVLIQPIKGVR